MAQKPSKIYPHIPVSAFFSAFFALVCLFVASTVRAQASTSSDAQQHFQTGLNFLRDPDAPQYEEAYVQFKLAYENSGKRWTVLGNLGLCAFKLERDGEAISYFETYLQQGGKQINARERAQVERDLLILKNSVAYVTVSSDVLQARLTDTRQRSSGRLVNTYFVSTDSWRVGLRAGHHTFVASAGERSETWEVDLTPGQNLEHRFMLKPLVTPSSGSLAPVVPKTVTASPPLLPIRSTPTTPVANPWRTVGFVSLGSGAALIVGGVVTGLLGQSAYNNAKNACVGGQCPESKRSTADQADTLATVTNVLWIGGGLLAVGGLTLVLTHPSPKVSAVARLVPSRGFWFSPVSLPAGAGVLATGYF